MEHLPVYIYTVFLLTVLLALILFYNASNYSKTLLVIIMVWIVFQSLVSLSGFYTHTNAAPPRFPFLVLPPIIFITIIFITKKGRNSMNGLNIKTLTILHIIRIPIEVVLFWLVAYKAVPKLITLEGRNFDIISGITAPVVYYWGFIKQKLSRNIIVAWNIICLILLLNVVFTAVLSIRTPFQQFAFDQPNIAVLYFPFVLLPSFLVPLVLFAHLASIRKLLTKTGNDNNLATD